MDVLRGYAQSYKDNIQSTLLSEQEAYFSYMLYLQPKLIYPLPCGSLTPAHCKYIQAPALAWLLPKLHLNRHMPHAILFEGPLYGGLQIPEFYTDRGVSQLQYLLGHLHMDDDIGKQILCLIFHA
jgi:hypothetical protein